MSFFLSSLFFYLQSLPLLLLIYSEYCFEFNTFSWHFYLQLYTFESWTPQNTHHSVQKQTSPQTLELWLTQVQQPPRFRVEWNCFFLGYLFGLLLCLFFPTRLRDSNMGENTGLLTNNYWTLVMFEMHCRRHREYIWMKEKDLVLMIFSFW